MSEIKIIGKMDNSIDHTFDSANIIYSTLGLAPTITTFCGGGQESKIMTAITNCIDKENNDDYK